MSEAALAASGIPMPDSPRLRLVEAGEATELDLVMSDADAALEGLDYNEIKAGFLPTSEFSCEELEDRLAARALARRPAGGKRIYEI